MGRYYINRTLFSTDIYIYDYKKIKVPKIGKMSGIELTDKELKEIIISERAKGREVNLWWKPRKGQRISDFQRFVERSTYNRVMDSDKEKNN